MSSLDSLTSLLGQLSRLEQYLVQLPDQGSDDILKTYEAAKLLQISGNAMRDLARAGEVPAWQIGNGFRFSRRQLLEHFRQRAAAPPQPSLPAAG